MALDDLLRAIEVEADEERLLADRDKVDRAAMVVDRARLEAAALEAELTRAPELEANAEADRKRSLARLDAAGAMRVGREEAFGSLLATIRAALAQRREDEDYPALFAALLAESRAALPSANELKVDRRDAALAGACADGLTVTATLDSWGGLELVSEDGRTILNTFEERLANGELLLRKRFAQWLANVIEDGSADTS